MDLPEILVRRTGELSLPGTIFSWKSRNSIDEITRLPTQLDLEENYINLTNNRNEEDFDSNDELLKFLYSKRREIIDDIQLIDSVLAQYH